MNAKRAGSRTIPRNAVSFSAVRSLVRSRNLRSARYDLFAPRRRREDLVRPFRRSMLDPGWMLSMIAVTESFKFSRVLQFS